MTMFQIKNVTLTHRKDLRTIIKDFSCVLNYGDKAVMIGEEGNGKSTLIKYIYNKELVSDYAEGTGECLCLRERLAYLPQELPATEKGKTLPEYFSEEPHFYELTPKELSRFAKDFHISTDFFYREQTLKTLSGGEKIKAQLLRLLMSEPTVLLLDEPSNDIDMETLDWLADFINRWPYIVLFISHDETLIEQTANKVIHIEQIVRKTECRVTVANVSYETYKNEREARFEKQEQLAQNERREKKIRDEKLRHLEQQVNSKLTNIAKADRDAVGQTLKKKMKAVKSLAHRYEREEEDMTQFPESEGAIYFRLGDRRSAIPAGKTVLDFSRTQLTIPGTQTLLCHDISLFLKGSEKICIIGKNGVGKTTLLRLIAEELLSRKDLHAEYMPQNYEELLHLEKTPVDFLSTVGDKEERTRIRTYLGSLKMTAEEMDHRVAELSGGQKAKVLLLKMSLSGANVLILDEPTRNFSPLSGGVIRRMLSDYAGAIISISHDRKYIREVCQKVYRLTEHGLQPLRKEDVESL